MPHRESSIHESLLRRVLDDFIEEGMSKSAVLHVAEDVCCTTPPIVETPVATTLLVTTHDFITPLSDTETRELLIKNGNSVDEARAIVRDWRRLAESMKYNGKVAWRVKAGFDFQEHAAKLGPCYNNWQNTSKLELRNKTLTENSLVFWIPRIVPGSTKKNVSEQLNLLARLRKEYNLPENHLTSFGSASLQSALILTHHNLNDERTPLDHLWIRTDTLRAGGDRLLLGVFGGDGLRCGRWGWDDYRDSDLGCFPLGVEALEHLDT